MLNEVVDIDYWCDVDVLTVWQAAFVMCNLEPWDEPISTHQRPPESVEKMRSTLLANVPHYETGAIFSPNGWSCKTKRPAQLSGLYFNKNALHEWGIRFFDADKLPLYLTK